MSNHPYVLIMAGGAGTRFWPASREHLPKQFLDISGSGKTLIRQTVDRFLAFTPKENIFIITYKDYGMLVREAIPELSADQIIEEPSRNNTAPSIALASFKLGKLNPDAVCIVAPADHIIQKEDEFNKVLHLATQHAAKNESIITLGITPTRADTGYGYIEYDKENKAEVKEVKSFREKPDKVNAEQYYTSGSFVWNAGIFIWKLSTILEAYRTHVPRMYEILHLGIELYNTADENLFVSLEYPKTEKISVDFAIMETAENVFTIPCDIGWSDLGTWTSLYDFSNKDKDLNATLSKPVFLENTHNSLVLSNKEKLIVIKGLEDFIVVDTDDCLMIYPKSEEQSIKTLKEKLSKSGLEKYL